jgi:hypothetical protein
MPSIIYSVSGSSMGVATERYAISIIQQEMSDKIKK